MKLVPLLGIGAALGMLTVVALLGGLQRRMLYFPTHDAAAGPLRPWIVDGRPIGYCHEVAKPHAVWLMTHGNAGQASDRAYVLGCLDPGDSLYVLEYPGYGARPGRPSREAFDAAAREAYRALRKSHPGVQVGLLGESIGSGPASVVAGETPAPDFVVLVVPFDNLVSVAAEHMPWLPVRWLMLDRWDNVSALRNYHGPLDIYGAVGDQVIPIAHAEKLARSLPGARLHRIDGGHNDWASGGEVRLAAPH